MIIMNKKYCLRNKASNQLYPTCYGFKKPIMFEEKRLAQKYLLALRDSDNYSIEEMN